MDNADAPLRKRPRKKKKKKYQNDIDDAAALGGGEEHEEEEDVPFFEPPKFEVGYDINILLSQIHNNTLRFLNLADPSGARKFTDYEMVAVAEAIRHNTSLLGVSLAQLPVTDASLVRLCDAIRTHACIRSVEFSALDGKEATAKALVRAVRNNTNIIHVTVTDCHFSRDQLEAIDTATQYNALECPDPRHNTRNDFSVVLPPDETMSSAKGERGHGRNHRPIEALGGKVVCAQFLKGGCRYGSRCLLYHPERSSVQQKAASSSQQQQPVLSAPPLEAAAAPVGFTLPSVEEVREVMSDQQQEGGGIVPSSPKGGGGLTMRLTLVVAAACAFGLAALCFGRAARRR